MQQAANSMAGPVGYADDEPQAVGARAGDQEGGGFLNLPAIKAFLWRQRLVLIGVTVLALIVGLIITLLMPPVYTAAATLRVNPNPTMIVQGQELADPSIPTNQADRYMRGIASILTSRNMALKVVDALGLQDSEAFVGEALAAGGGDENAEQMRREIAASVLRSSLSVDVPLNSQVIAIYYSSEDPVLAARIANAYADTLMEENLRQGAGANSYALAYLEEQIGEVRSRLEEAETRAIDYARANRIVAEPIIGPAPVDPGTTGQTGVASTVTVGNLASVNQSYTSARANRIAAEQIWRSAANVPATELPMIQQNPVVQSLRQRKMTLEATRSDLIARYREDYPQIRELDAQIAELDRQIGEASAEIKDSIRSNYQIAQRQEEALAREVDRVSNATLDEQDRRVQYNLIDRDAQALRAQLAALLSRYNQVSSAANLESTTVSWLDRATVPGAPSSPDLILNMVLSFITGLGLAMGIAVLRESFDDRIRSTDQLERKLQLPVLGRTPFVSEEIQEEIEDPFTPISEAYASIRATVDHAVRREHAVIQLTSSEPGEGKTTSAVALARKYASIGRKVLLVDLDLRRPGLTKMFGNAAPEVGVLDVLNSRVPLERALLPMAVENLDILPVAEVPANPVETMSSTLIVDFIERYRNQYDVIILDSSPVLGIADAPLLSRHVDAVVFVVEANQAQIGKAKVALRRLDDMNANLVGVVLTKFRAREAGENSEDQRHYYDYNSRTA